MVLKTMVEKAKKAQKGALNVGKLYYHILSTVVKHFLIIASGPIRNPLS
jgi:hypothetical protein